MPRGRYTLDREPGALPDIRRDIGGIVFVIAPPGVPRGNQLVIRCDDDGEVKVSIRVDPAAA
jgi:hypothetical protein